MIRIVFGEKNQKADGNKKKLEFDLFSLEKKTFDQLNEYVRSCIVEKE